MWGSVLCGRHAQACPQVGGRWFGHGVLRSCAPVRPRSGGACWHSWACENRPLPVTLPPTFIQRERDSGFEFCPFGRVEQRGWRGALRIAQRQAPLWGEGLGKLGRGLPAEAGMWPFHVVVRAPGGTHAAAGSRTDVGLWPVLSIVPATQSLPGEPPHSAWSSGNSQSPGTPAARSSRDVPPDAQPLAALRRASPLFSKEIFQRGIVEHWTCRVFPPWSACGR